MRAWNHWYHCTAHTYGTWLRGDHRGWRSRHHREHVVGDYQNPPPLGLYAKLYERSKRLMKRDPVKIDREDVIDFILRCMIDRLTQFQTPIAIAEFDGVHFHGLIQCVDHDPKIKLGIAKQYATAQLKKHIEALGIQHEKAHGSAVGLCDALGGFGEVNLKLGEGLWGRGSHPTSIEDANHWCKTYGYIFDHAERGAIVIASTTNLPEAEFLRDFDLIH